MRLQRDVKILIRAARNVMTSEDDKALKYLADHCESAVQYEALVSVIERIAGGMGLGEWTPAGFEKWMETVSKERGGEQPIEVELPIEEEPEK